MIILSLLLDSRMCNLRVISDTEMVISTYALHKRLISKIDSATPCQRVKPGQFSKSLSPKQQRKTACCYYQASTTRSHSRPIPARTTSNPQYGRGSGHGLTNRCLLTRPQSFAGSKCYVPPTPSSLPKPPIDWFAAVGGRGSELEKL